MFALSGYSVPSQKPFFDTINTCAGVYLTDLIFIEVGTVPEIFIFGSFALNILLINCFHLYDRMAHRMSCLAALLTLLREEK